MSQQAGPQCGKSRLNVFALNRLKWIPIVVCFAAARADQKPALSQFGKTAGE